jgi:hypothetical protein
MKNTNMPVTSTQAVSAATFKSATVGPEAGAAGSSATAAADPTVMTTASASKGEIRLRHIEETSFGEDTASRARRAKRASDRKS